MSLGLFTLAAGLIFLHSGHPLWMLLPFLGVSSCLGHFLLEKTVRRLFPALPLPRMHVERITEDALYLLDEPENSLSVPRQLELRDFLADSARYFGCQILLSTHSPVLLSIPGAEVWDLDADPAVIRPWTAVTGVRAYYDFFKTHAAAFEQADFPKDQIQED